MMAMTSAAMTPATVARARSSKSAMEPKSNITRVGIGVMIFKDGKILLGKRNGSHGAGEYSFTGGHLDYMESFEGCARRETLEEAGIEIANVRFQCLSNVTHYAPKHYVHVGLIADWKSGDAQVMELEKCESWGWYDLGQLPEPLFEVTKRSIEFYKSQTIYADIPRSE